MIVELLKHGKQNAITTQELCRMAGIEDVRTLRREVARERKTGEIIASCCAGYYIPTDIKEIEEFVHTLDSKARSIMVALQSARKYLKDAVDADQITFDQNTFSQIETERGCWDDAEASEVLEGYAGRKYDYRCSEGSGNLTGNCLQVSAGSAVQSGTEPAPQ